jgi:hypothetical protein
LLVLEQFYILKKILKFLLPFILNTHSLVKMSKNQEIILFLIQGIVYSLSAVHLYIVIVRILIVLINIKGLYLNLYVLGGFQEEKGLHTHRIKTREYKGTKRSVVKTV